MKQHKNVLLLALLAFAALAQLVVGCQKTLDSEDVVSKEFEVVFPDDSPAAPGGISNAIGTGGNWYAIAASDPATNFPGYPDPNSKFYKLTLTGSDFEVPLEPGARASDPNHAHLALTPTGNLAVVYQKPTGTAYGFDLIYKEFSTAGALLKNEKVFANKNWGAWPRLEFASDGTAHMASFAHAGYSIRYFRKQPGSAVWQSYQLTQSGTYFSELQAVMNGDVFFVAARRAAGNVQALQLCRIVGNTYIYQDLAQNIQNNCDLAADGTGDVRLLYTAAGQLKTKRASDAQEETIAFENAIAQRAKMAWDNNNRLTTAYQTPNRLVVMRKQNGQWSKIWEQTFPSSLTDEQMGQGPSLLRLGSGGLHVVFQNGEGIVTHALQ